MKEVKAPKVPYEAKGPLIFLAGGITNCPDWQQELVDMLSDSKFRGTLLNPRQANFDISDKSASENQIAWEYHQFKEASASVFWFPKETICPIVLFELGWWLGLGKKPFFVAVHPRYPRRQDVEQQVGLRYGRRVGYSLEDLAQDIRWYI